MNWIVRGRQGRQGIKGGEAVSGLCVGIGNVNVNVV